MATQRIEVFQSQLASHQGLISRHHDEMMATVQALATRGKGLLAADESVGSVAKRFKSIPGLENNAENRRRYRELMIGAEGLEQYISGVIFHEETLTQHIGTMTFAQYCTQRGIVPGVKTDKGLQPLRVGAPNEEGTDGLDGYVARAETYYQHGARFCKWRNVYRIQNGTVSEALVHHNAQTLARYAVLSQVAGLVPIVEPEVMIDGTHNIEQCQAVSERVWREVTHALHQHGVVWECMMLKPNMVVPGAECPQSKTVAPEQVARCTVTALSRTIPAAVRGIVFLSGGLSEVNASEYLNAINAPTLMMTDGTSACRSGISRPWNLSFSYARALQSSALNAWQGQEDRVADARRVFLHRAKMNAQAQLGQYNRAADNQTSESLYVKGHTY